MSNNSDSLIISDNINFVTESKDLFFGQNNILAVETPDLKIIEDSFIYTVSVPRILTTRTLGAVFGEDPNHHHYLDKDVREYKVEVGDTVGSVANKFGISSDSIIWANELSRSSVIKVGQNLVIPPVSGTIHIVNPGDTVSEIAQTYKSDAKDIVSFNELKSEGDIFIGDILVVPGGVMPKKAIRHIAQSPVANSFFIYPTEGVITQGLHWYNAIDVANRCGTSINASASGVVQRATYGWNHGGGNLVTILHSGNIVTYYGHLQTILVSPGQKVNVGDRIGLMGGGRGMPGAGISTGCHLHFGVSGARNPLSSYFLGSRISY